MDSLKIHVVIAGRTYPIRVKDELEEQGIRSAAKRINDLMVNYESSFAVHDKQDTLAMCALQFASQLEIKTLEKAKDDVFVKNQLSDLIKMLDALEE